MANPSNTLHNLEVTLRSVIESLIDGQEGFQRIGDEFKDDTLKRYFLAESLRRAQFRGELESVLHHEGIHDVKEADGQRCRASSLGGIKGQNGRRRSHTPSDRRKGRRRSGERLSQCSGS